MNYYDLAKNSFNEFKKTDVYALNKKLKGSFFKNLIYNFKKIPKTFISLDGIESLSQFYASSKCKDDSGKLLDYSTFNLINLYRNLYSISFKKYFLNDFGYSSTDKFVTKITKNKQKVLQIQSLEFLLKQQLLPVISEEVNKSFELVNHNFSNKLESLSITYDLTLHLPKKSYSNKVRYLNLRYSEIQLLLNSFWSTCSPSSDETRYVFKRQFWS